MTSGGATVAVSMGFMPEDVAIPDPDHPGLRRAGERASAPYDNDLVRQHLCPATDGTADAAAAPDLLEAGFDVVDLSGFDELQNAFAAVRAAGRIDDDQAATIRAQLDGAVLPCAGGRTVKVLYLAGEGFIMRKSGPNRMSVVGPRSVGMNDHGGATSIHADQDVYGTPLTQLMDGRAPSLFRHHSPDGANDEAGLMLVNLWIPLQQITQPLVLGDGRSIDRRRHQLRYGLATQSFLERDDDMVINDIWTFLHDPDQRWYLRSAMDHRSAYVFDTLSTPHGAAVLPGEDVAERCYRMLEAAESAVRDHDPNALRAAVADDVPEPGDDVPAALRAAIGTMVAVADEARDRPDKVCGPEAEAWLAASQAARAAVVRMSLEMRVVVSIDAD
ncbi:MAG: hypothetical protein R2699_19140 [Acidimicrobiales bacterium]|nr:hypothetical protein [Acidimicrobiales bacterium]